MADPIRQNINSNSAYTGPKSHGQPASEQDQEKEKPNQEVLKMQKELQERLRLMDDRYKGAGKTAAETGKELKETGFFGWAAGRKETLKEQLKKEEKFAQKLVKEKEGLSRTEKRIQELMKEGKYDQAKAVMEGKEKEFLSVGQSRKNTTYASKSLQADYASANEKNKASEELLGKTETGMRAVQTTAKYAAAAVAVTIAAPVIAAGAVIAAPVIAAGVAAVGLTGGAATVATAITTTAATILAGTTVGTVAGSTLSATSNSVEAGGHIARGNKTVRQASKDAWDQTKQDTKQSALTALGTATGGQVAGKIAGEGVSLLRQGFGSAMAGLTNGTITQTEARLEAEFAFKEEHGDKLKNMSSEEASKLKTEFLEKRGVSNRQMAISLGTSALAGGQGGTAGALRDATKSTIAKTGITLAEGGLSLATGLGSTYLKDGEITFESAAQEISSVALNDLVGNMARRQAKESHQVEEPLAPETGPLPIGIASVVVNPQKNSKTPSPTPPPTPESSSSEPASSAPTTTSTTSPSPSTSTPLPQSTPPGKITPEQKRSEITGNTTNSILEHGLVSSKGAQQKGITRQEGADAKTDRAGNVKVVEGELVKPGGELPPVYYEDYNDYLGQSVKNYLTGENVDKSPVGILGERNHPSLIKELEANGKDVVNERLKSGVMYLMSKEESTTHGHHRFPERGYESISPDKIEAIFVPKDLYASLKEQIPESQRSKLIPVEGEKPLEALFPEHRGDGLVIPDWEGALGKYLSDKVNKGDYETRTFMTHSARLPTKTEIGDQQSHSKPDQTSHSVEIPEKPFFVKPRKTQTPESSNPYVDRKIGSYDDSPDPYREAVHGNAKSWQTIMDDKLREGGGKSELGSAQLQSIESVVRNLIREGTPEAAKLAKDLLTSTEKLNPRGIRRDFLTPLREDLTRVEIPDEIKNTNAYKYAERRGKVEVHVDETLGSNEAYADTKNRRVTVSPDLKEGIESGNKDALRTLSHEIDHINRNKGHKKDHLITDPIVRDEDGNVTRTMSRSEYDARRYEEEFGVRHSSEKRFPDPRRANKAIQAANALEEIHGIISKGEELLSRDDKAGAEAAFSEAEKIAGENGLNVKAYKDSFETDYKKNTDPKRDEVGQKGNMILEIGSRAKSEAKTILENLLLDSMDYSDENFITEVKEGLKIAKEEGIVDHYLETVEDHINRRTSYEVRKAARDILKPSSGEDGVTSPPETTLNGKNRIAEEIASTPKEPKTRTDSPEVALLPPHFKVSPEAQEKLLNNLSESFGAALLNPNFEVSKIAKDIWTGQKAATNKRIDPKRYGKALREKFYEVAKDKNTPHEILIKCKEFARRFDIEDIYKNLILGRIESEIESSGKVNENLRSLANAFGLDTEVNEFLQAKGMPDLRTSNQIKPPPPLKTKESETTTKPQPKEETKPEEPKAKSEASVSETTQTIPVIEDHHTESLKLAKPSKTTFFEKKELENLPPIEIVWTLRDFLEPELKALKANGKQGDGRVPRLFDHLLKGKDFNKAAKDSGYSDLKEAKSSFEDFLKKNDIDEGVAKLIYGEENNSQASNNNKISSPERVLKELTDEETGTIDPKGHLIGIRSEIKGVKINLGENGELGVEVDKTLIGNRPEEQEKMEHGISELSHHIRDGYKLKVLGKNPVLPKLFKIEKDTDKTDNNGTTHLACIHGSTNARIYGEYNASTGEFTIKGATADHGEWGKIIQARRASRNNNGQ